MTDMSVEKIRMKNEKDDEITFRRLTGNTIKIKYDKILPNSKI
jgi:hypothetical protein